MIDTITMLIGPAMFAFAGIAFMRFGNKYKKLKNNKYTQGTIGKAEVVAPNYAHRCWLCKFIDGDGNELFCLSDLEPVMPSLNITMPKEGAIEEVLLTKYDDAEMDIDGKKISYIVHFCNDEYYSLLNREVKIKSTLFYVVADICYVAALISLILNLV